MTKWTSILSDLIKDCMTKSLTDPTYLAWNIQSVFISSSVMLKNYAKQLLVTNLRSVFCRGLRPLKLVSLMLGAAGVKQLFHLNHCFGLYCLKIFSSPRFHCENDWKHIVHLHVSACHLISYRLKDIILRQAVGGAMRLIIEVFEKQEVLNVFCEGESTCYTWSFFINN